MLEMAFQASQHGLCRAGPRKFSNVFPRLGVFFIVSSLNVTFTVKKRNKNTHTHFEEQNVKVTGLLTVNQDFQELFSWLYPRGTYGVILP